MKEQTLKNSMALGLALITVIANGLIGHYFAPNGITYTPIVLTITTALVVFGTKNVSAMGLATLTYLFVALNDISIKLYSGGSHDYEGLGWIHGLLIIGLVPTTAILLIGIWRRRNKRISAIIAISLFLGLIVLQYQLFSHLGLGRCWRC